MAAPSAITLREISTEALKKAGYHDPASEQAALITRAEDAWMREIKNDIFTVSKKLTSLQSEAIVTLIEGRSRYDLPTDFSSLLSMRLLSGNTTGTAQAGTTTSLTLSASDASTTSIEGKELVFTGGTGANQYSQIYDYDTSTKVASFYPAVTTAGSSDTTYLIVDQKDPLTEYPIWDYDKLTYTYPKVKPTQYFPIGDADDGQFLLAQTPDSVTRAVLIRYYSDLTRLDVDGTLMSTLYRRWENVWKAGIYWKALEHQDDDGKEDAKTAYSQKVQELTMREEYGDDLSNIRARIQEDE